MGMFAAFTIILLWGSHLYYLLFHTIVTFSSPVFYFHFLLQTYLYTGLFITAHDSMHGTVSGNKFMNRFIGSLSSLLYAGLSYKRLLVNHRKHHASPGTEKDPDFYIKSQNFFIWWGMFMWRYLSLTQIVLMAIIFNILKAYTFEVSIWFYLVIPAILSSIQLFYFGTYLPHRKPHTEEMIPHNSRTQRKNHLAGMLSCYFFGYHYEHHDSPSTPWWRLYRTKK